jgi:molecular chaperone DnaK (HSP70)
MKNIKIINESSAITMYYGYTKYKDIFLNKEKKIDPNIEKNILFIDIGYSKTSFILSKFKYNEFKVEYVLCDDNLGGRNFDELIFNYCIEEFKKKNKYETINVNNKMRYRLIESIKSARIKLTVNTETLILVDVFYNDIDLKIILTRQKFEELIIEYINKFKNILKSILNYSKKNNLNINEIELAGEIMTTPIFQRIIEDNKLKISKGILIDECCSVGAALLGNYIKKTNFPFKHLQNFYPYNYYPIQYNIVYDKKLIKDETILPKGTIIDNNLEIRFDNFNHVKTGKLMLFFPDNEKEEKSKKNNFYKRFDISLDCIFEDFKNELKNNDLKFKIHINDDQSISIGKLYIGDQQIKQDYEILIGDIYIVKTNDRKNFKEKLIQHINLQEKKDKLYNLYIDDKTNLSNIIYSLKNYIETNNINEELDEIKNIEELIKKKDLNQESLNKIKNQIEQIKQKISQKKESSNENQ